MSDPLVTSALLRSLKLGSLVGRVGASLVGARLVDIGRSDETRQRRRAAALVKNAERVVATLGELRGAAMKVGQMLSLYEGLLPPDVTEVLRSLQKKAPPVPGEVMRYEVEGALPDFDRVFAHLDDHATAAASIGQVHRGRLRDGREVAVKIQYPLIDQIVAADLSNLRTLFTALFGMLSDMDFEPIWQEVRDRLLEELDYRLEAANMTRMAELHRDTPGSVIPRVVPEAAARTVLTMEYAGGRSGDEACHAEVPAELRGRWGHALLELVLRGMMEHRLVHADPNLANFAFRDDGRVVVYDFGCVKRVPDELAVNYGRLLTAALEGRRAELPGILAAIGLRRQDGAQVEQELVDPYVDALWPIVATDSFTFGDDDTLYQRLLELGRANWSEASDLHLPHDVLFVDRALVGHFGNLHRLRATANWRELILRHARAAAGRGGSG